MKALPAAKTQLLDALWRLCHSTTTRVHSNSPPTVPPTVRVRVFIKISPPIFLPRLCSKKKVAVETKEDEATSRATGENCQLVQKCSRRRKSLYKHGVTALAAGLPAIR